MCKVIDATSGESACDIVPIWRFNTLHEPIEPWRSSFQATLQVGVAFRIIIWVIVVKTCSLWGGPLHHMDLIDVHFIQVSNIVRWKLEVECLVNLDDYFVKSMTKEHGKLTSESTWTDWNAKYTKNKNKKINFKNICANMLLRTLKR